MMPREPRWGELQTLYSRLGLTPLDEFLQASYQQNQSRLTVGGLLDTPAELSSETESMRQIGATTWMCVRAMMDLLAGRSVTILTPYGHDEQIRILSVVRGHMRVLNNETGTVLPARNRVRFSRALLSVLATPDPRNQHDLVYDDVEWAERARRRLGGPYEMMREVRLENGVLRAYAEEDEFLMELTPEAANDILASGMKVDFTNVPVLEDGIILSGGTGLPNKNGDDFSPLVQKANELLRGPLSLDEITAVTKTRRWLDPALWLNEGKKWIRR